MLIANIKKPECKRKERPELLEALIDDYQLIINMTRQSLRDQRKQRGTQLLI